MAKKTKTQQLAPNPEQEAVINAGEGYWRIASGPGSGKSFCLVQRYVRLLQSGVKPENILSLTFTNSAAKSMRERAEAIIPVQKIDRTSGWMTFHSLALQFATQEREHFPFKLADFPLATEPIAMKISGDVARKFEIDPRQLRPWISVQKRNRVRPADAVKQAELEGKNEQLALAYKSYDSKLRENGVLDFDSLLFEMVDLLSVPPRGKETTARFSLADRWNFQFIQSDESQDNDQLQWTLLRLMSQKYQNLLAVGDAGQNLYSFRGSSASLFMDMEKMFAGTKTLYLAKNHRSSKQIVDMCRSCGPIPEMAERFHTDNPDGPVPTVTGYPSAVDEAKAVATGCSNLSKGHTAAVLARTNRALRTIEDVFSTEGIKYYYQGRSGYWSQPEVRAVLAYVQCVLYPTDAAVMAALRSPFHPSKYIKKTELAAKVKAKPEGQTAAFFLSRYADDNVRRFVHFLDGLRRYREVPPGQAMKSILNELHAIDYYREEEASPDNSPLENLQELCKIALRFSSLKEFLDFARRASAASKSKRGICISTVHAAKGLEYDSVFFIALNDGILPHSKAESLDDEKNVFFVGVSRAKTNLHLSFAGPPSQFLGPYLKKEPVLDDEVFA